MYFIFVLQLNLLLLLLCSDAQSHIATIHWAISLLPLLEAEGLLEDIGVPVPPSTDEALPADSYPPKRCDVRLRREDAVSQAILEAELDLSHTCDLPTCTKVNNLFTREQ